TRGSATLRQLYLSGSFEDALGMPLEQAEREWHTFLRTRVDLPPEARALARARFERPRIFGQICPHRIATLRTELSGDLAAGDDEGAIRSCHRILTLDAGQSDVRASLAEALAFRGRFGEVDREIARLVGPPAAASP